MKLTKLAAALTALLLLGSQAVLAADETKSEGTKPEAKAEKKARHAKSGKKAEKKEAAGEKKEGAAESK